MKKSYDYKKFVYLKVPVERYEEIINNKERIDYEEIIDWRRNYEGVIYDKRAGASKANAEKQKRTLNKLIKALKDLNSNIFLKEEDKKNLTSYRLAKIAKVNYLTARKYFNEEIQTLWKKNPKDAIITLELMREHI